MRLTENQSRVLTSLIKRNPDATDLDLDQLLDKLSADYDWITSKASLQFTIRQLLKVNLMERCELEQRRGKSRRVLRITKLGKKVMGWTGVSSDSEDESDDPV
jgi:hypothetical protein